LTAYELEVAGLVFVRDERASLVAVRGPQALCDEARAQVQRRVASMRAPRATLSGRRWGACEQCGDAMDSNRGGWCELCAIARRVALRESGVEL
jgi:hypothetical protein